MGTLGRQAEPSANTWPNDPHGTTSPAPLFIHSGIEHEVTNRTASPEPRPPSRQGELPQDVPRWTLDIPANGFPPSLYPYHAANLHTYSLPIQPSAPGLPQIVSTTSTASGSKSPIVSNQSRGPTTTISPRVAFPSRKLSGSPDIMPTPDPSGDPATMANQDPLANHAWKMYARTQPPADRMEDIAWRTMELQEKREEARNTVDVPNPLTKSPAPTTVVVPSWGLGETGRDQRSSEGSAARISAVGSDAGGVDDPGCVRTPMVLC